jgi:hypothetical protein
MREDDIFINIQPGVLAAEIARVIQSVSPSERDISEVQRQVLCRHSELGLGKKTTPEEVIEGFFRCLLTDHFQRHFKIKPLDIPNYINSSHTATRGICIAGLLHNHHHITDAEWGKSWRRFQDQHQEANIYVPGGRSPRRADLYLVARGGIVSVEFKYLGSKGSLNVDGCAAQMRRYIENHAATLLVIYDSSSNGKEVRGLDRLRSLLSRDVHVIIIYGPAISRV